MGEGEVGPLQIPKDHCRFDNMKEKSYGLFTRTQLEVLKLRVTGMSHQEIASRLGTTRQNIAMIDKRYKRNLRLAEETLLTYKKLSGATAVDIMPNVHKVDIPRLVIDAADKSEIKLRANFTRIFDEIHFKAPECVSGTKIIKPLTILLLKNGDIEVVPGECTTFDDVDRG